MPGKGKAVKPPVRLGFMYMPHGVIMDQFWPASPETFLSHAAAGFGIACVRCSISVC